MSNIYEPFRKADCVFWMHTKPASSAEVGQVGVVGQLESCVRGICAAFEFWIAVVDHFK